MNQLGSTVCDMRDIYYLESADGSSISVCKEVFAAFGMFMGKGKPAGSVTISFLNGNVAGVIADTKVKLK